MDSLLHTHGSNICFVLIDTRVNEPGGLYRVMVRCDLSLMVRSHPPLGKAVSAMSLREHPFSIRYHIEVPVGVLFTQCLGLLRFLGPPDVAHH